MRCKCRCQNCIPRGSSGTGKMHTVLGLGLASCQKGYSVAFTTAAVLVHEHMEERDERVLCALQKHLNTVQLLIVDELGCRWLRTALRSVHEWASTFGSERLTGALLDRLNHHVDILEMNCEGYRLATSKNAQRRSAQGHGQNPRTPRRRSCHQSVNQHKRTK
ncbi:MAG: ATP-binding protein [Methylocella sp.]